MESNHQRNPTDLLEGKLADPNFLTSYSNKDFNGSIRIPKSFNRAFEKNIDMKEVKLICKEGGVWEGVYFEEHRVLYGLDKYFARHELKLHTLMYIEFYKTNKLVMLVCLPHGPEGIFKSNAESACYLKNSIEIISEENCESDLEVENSKALQLLNGYGIQRTYAIHVESNYLNKSFKRLILDIDYFEIYEQWNSGERIKFRLGERIWEIQIHQGCRGQFCSLGEGWHEFTHDLRIKAYDKLYPYEGHARSEVQFCFMRSNVLMHHRPPKGIQDYETSFYHFVSESSLQGGHIVNFLHITNFIYISVLILHISWLIDICFKLNNLCICGCLIY